MSRFIRSIILLPIPFVPKLSVLAIMFLATGVAGTAAAQRAEITPGSLNFEAVSGVAASQPVTATTLDADGNAIAPTSRTWESSDESVATVRGRSTPGVTEAADVRAVGEGTATITFTAETPPSGNSPATTVTATATVTVTLDDLRLEVSPTELRLTSLGETQTISVRVYDETMTKSRTRCSA